MYDLTAVMVHKGKTHEGGHYVVACQLGEGAAKLLADRPAKGAAEQTAKGVAEAAVKGACHLLLPLLLLLVVCFPSCSCQHACPADHLKQGKCFVHFGV